MIDCHIHIERGEYNIEWINEFIRYAKERNIQEIYLLEHSHRFKEFYPIYENVIKNNHYQEKWINKKNKIDLSYYTQFIKEMHNKSFPVRIKWGLEVCYIPEFEDIIQEVLSIFNWDFVTGSVHWINGWGFDHPNNKDEWEIKDINKLYEDYYEIMLNLIESKLFDIVAHPDSLKCFNFYPSINMKEIYEKAARKMKANNMKSEYSCGLFINYKHNEFGPNKDFLNALLRNKVELLTCTDAHSPKDVGRYIQEANERLTKTQ